MLRRRNWGTVRVFLIAFAVYAYFMPRWADWNIDSRLDLVHAIVDDHTLSIDRYHWDTWDKAVHAGHYYSDKAPGTALLGVPVYAVFVALHHVPGVDAGIRHLEKNSAWKVAVRLGESNTQRQPAAKGTNLGGCQRSGTAGNVQFIPWGNRLVPPMEDWALSKYVVTVGVDALLSAAFVAFFFWFLGFFSRAKPARLALTGLMAFATVALPYATNFYSHMLAAGFLFVAFGLILLRGRQEVGAWSAPLAGFLLGLSLLTEYTVAIIVAALAVFSVWTFRRSTPSLIAAIAVGIVPLIALLAYNGIAFGNPLDTGYSHDFCWSAAQGQGYAGFTYPHSGPLWDLTFGPYRGLFFMSPFLLLALPGGIIMTRRRLALPAWVCLASSVVFILAISAYWGWNGGRVDGPRYLVPIVPFLAFPVFFVLSGSRLPSVRLVLSAILAVWSVAATSTLFLGGELFPISWLRNPYTDYSLPALRSNEIAPNAGLFFGLHGWESLLPLLLLLLVITLAPSWPERSR